MVSINVRVSWGYSSVGFVLWRGEAGGILTKIVLGVCQSGIKIVILTEPKPIYSLPSLRQKVLRQFYKQLPRVRLQNSGFQHFIKSLEIVTFHENFHRLST